MNEAMEETTAIVDHEANVGLRQDDGVKQQNDTIVMVLDERIREDVPQQRSGTDGLIVSDGVCDMDAMKDIIPGSIVQRESKQEMLQHDVQNEVLQLEDANERKDGDGQSMNIMISNNIEQLTSANESEGDDQKSIDLIAPNNIEQLGDANESRGDDRNNIEQLGNTNESENDDRKSVDRIISKSVQPLHVNTVEVDDGQLVNPIVLNNILRLDDVNENGSKTKEGKFVDVAIRKDDETLFHTTVNINDDKRRMQEKDLLMTVMTILEARHLKESRPLPVLLRGKEIDLLKLSMQVTACGGYDRTAIWSTISKSLGFGQECGPLLKLVYVKYLKVLENQRLVEYQGIRSESNGNGESPHAVDLSSKGISIESSETKRATSSEEVVEKSVSMGQSDVETSDSLAEMLEWLKRLALNPGDLRKGQGPRTSKWNEASAKRCEKIARKVRAVLGMDFIGEKPLRNPVGRPKKRGRRKGDVQKGSAKKARLVTS